MAIGEKFKFCKWYNLVCSHKKAKSPATKHCAAAHAGDERVQSASEFVV